jgi:D-alanyl-D-alanine carboxypeptidase/D-alanyl-D-alanine-endopeptidase (penicillin-binding protein 4)
MILASLLVVPSIWAAPLESPKLKGAITAAIVTELDGSVLFERFADTRVMPASNEKLFTCAFALAQRGKDYTSKTRIWRTDDSIQIVADGDPTLDSSKLAEVRTLLGKVSEAKVFLKQAYVQDRPDSWQLGDAPNRYAPAIHAFSVDKAGFEVWLGPEGVKFKPHEPEIKKIQLLDSSGSKSSVKFNPLASELTVLGPMPLVDTKVDTLSDPNPSETALKILTGSGTAKELKDVPTALNDITLSSPPISQLISDCLKPSDNCLAEHLLFIGSAKPTYSEAQKSISQWLIKSVGLEAWAFKVEDGSGLSRKNITTARSVSKLLAWAAKQPTFNLWQNSLAASGAGTLAKRLKGIDFKGKTGTLAMVSALSGYVKCTNGKTRIVSVILNQYGCSETDAREALDQFIENVAKK